MAEITDDDVKAIEQKLCCPNGCRRLPGIDERCFAEGHTGSVAEILDALEDAGWRIVKHEHSEAPP
ncbi:MAG: hypothetical protein AB7F22_28945 [Reyranella sp.]|uniref:hypothetical protein n=1 Tax=Reyranella sp. TaxID=1929291 RepID=UPI003D13E616